MKEGLLQTKIEIPRLRTPSLVRRARLFEKLNQGLEGAVTLVAAPAGFGKTTLVAEWLHDLGSRISDFGLNVTADEGQFRNPQSAIRNQTAWLSLDEGDNDLARFLTYLAAALDGVVADAGEAALAMLQSPRMPAVETIVTPLINDINRAREPFLLVLDDYHVIKEERIHEAVAFLLGHMPPPLHLVLISRADPPLPLARLRGQGALNEVRQRDLAFTVEETAAFLNEALGLGLSGGNLARLNRRTEGWAAGLQMAAVSLRQQADPAAFIEAFTGSNRYVLDYLMEEVLAGQPPAVQRFLLATSVLERLSAPLCAAVMEAVPDPVQMDGGEDWTAVLEQLDAAHLFVVPLDDQRAWYRYHRLFADLLRQRLRETDPDLEPLLHARARDWFWQEGRYEEAAVHAFEAGDDEKAARLIEEAAEPALQKSRVHTILRWVEALPAGQLDHYPHLATYYAWALLLSGAALEDIEGWLPQTEGEALPAAVLMLAFLNTFRGRMAEARRLARQALDGFAPGDHFWRSMAVWALSISDHDPTAVAADDGLAWEDAVRAAEESGNLLVLVSAMCEQAHAKKRRGQLHEARVLFERALALATPRGERPLPIAGEALMGLAEIDLEWNDLTSAEALLLDGLAHNKRWREVAALPGYFQLARLRHAQGDGEGADAALREAARLAVLFDTTELDDVIVAAYRARLWIMQGRAKLARPWVQERGLEDAANPSDAASPSDSGQYAGLRPFEELVLARLYLAEGAWEKALPLLERLLAVFGRWQHTRLIIETLLLRAQAFMALGEREKGLDTLHKALTLGEPGNFMRIFLDEGEPLQRLLDGLRVPEAGSQAYVDRLAEAAGVGRAVPDGTQPLIEPLSERELQILQLVAEGLSNKEIGQRLYLSVPTIKWHTSNIYGKLGVKNRTTAVARARELAILPRQ